LSLGDRLRNWFGIRPARAAGPDRAPALGRQLIQARYENAQTTDENRRNWFAADYLSAKSANNFQVRRQLRTRSRHEVSNNPYLYGVATSNADHLVNTGPTLQCLRTSAAENRQIESAWNAWCDEVDLTEKLRTLKLAKTVDGEGFLVLKTVDDLEHPVRLYPVDVEADQVTTPAPRSLTELWVDGLTLHPVTGRPVAYDVLRSHPGDYFFPNLNPLAVDRIKAKHVIHWFTKFRPGQVRGVPAFTTALDLFTELRSFRRAVLAKANIAANLTAVLESEAPADEDGTQTATPWESIPIDRGVYTTLPGGAKMHPFEAAEPSTTYEVFQEKCLGEAVRPLGYPLNLALGTSQKFNFSSARLDHVNYRDGLTVERGECNRLALDRIFRAWLEEAILIPGLLPAGVRGMADVPHAWHWPGFAPLDPVQDATADHARISNGTLTWQQFWASRGYDWREVMAQQAQERQEIEKLHLVFGDPLKKTDTVTEDGPAKPAPAAAPAPRIEAYDPEQPRDDQGRFGAGEHAETHQQWAKEDADLAERQEREESALEDGTHDDEERQVDRTRAREDRLTERQRDKEDRLTERQRDKEDRPQERQLRREFRKEEEVMERRHREQTAADQAAVREAIDRHGQNSREVREAHERAVANDAGRRKELQELIRREDARKDELTRPKQAARHAEDQARQSRRDAEDAAKQSARDAEDQARYARQGKEVTDLHERHQQEEEAAYDRRQAENPAAHQAYYHATGKPRLRGRARHVA
jgi:lambda family phage portal protein